MSLLAPAELGWPLLTIGRRRPIDAESRPDDLPIAELRFGDEVAELWLSDTESLRLTRSPLAVMFTTRTPLSDDMVAHPFIALPAAVCSRWHDRQILHGGGVVVGGVAWAILGTKEAGKSSTLGWLPATAPASSATTSSCCRITVCSPAPARSTSGKRPPPAWGVSGLKSSPGEYGGGYDRPGPRVAASPRTRPSRLGR